MAERLREALDEGRLTLTEYDERLRQAYAARTYGQLDGILDDLPTAVPPQRSQVAQVSPAGPADGGPQPDAAAQPRKGLPAWIVVTWGSWLTSSLICWTIWLATGADVYPWPVWVSGPWGAVLLGRTLLALASGDPERYIQENHDHEQRSCRERRRGWRDHREYRRG